MPANPLQVARYRERHSVSGAKSDHPDAHTRADVVHTDAHQLRQVAADREQAAAVKVVARPHKTLIWERTRQVQRLRHHLLGSSPQPWMPAAIAAACCLADCATGTVRANVISHR